MFRDFFGRFARRAAPAIVRRESLDLPALSRRRFILTAAAGGAGLLLVPKAAKLLLPYQQFLFSRFQTIIPARTYWFDRRWVYVDKNAFTPPVVITG